MDKRKFMFNAWLPKIGVMLEAVTLYNDRNIGIDYDWFKDAIEEKGYECGDSQVLKDGKKIIEFMEGEDWIFLDPKDCIILQYSGYNVKGKKQCFDGDICEMVDDLGKNIRVVCKYGTARRYMINGDNKATVDIEGFYFIRPDGKKTFPIVKNYAGKHDLQIMKKIGNIYENPELKYFQ